MEKKTRAKRSILWKIPKEELIEIVKQSSTITQVLNKYGLDNKGGNHHTLKKRLIEDNIDYSHITSGCNHNKGKTFAFKPFLSNEEIFVENSSFNRTHLKARIIRQKLLEYKCVDCGLSGMWNNKPISLHIDHINGISDDNRLNNLRFLCPNCHSQTHTYAGKSISKSKVVKNTCIDCGNEVGSLTIRCEKCESIHKRKVPDRPSLEILLKQTEELGYKGTGRLYGVTDNTVRKWLIQYRKAPPSPNSFSFNHLRSGGGAPNSL
jgi:Zn finger protein HypA/HybF involved in hydrogenase expression